MVASPMLNSLVIIAVTLSVVTAVPANNWDVPCFHGECAYDLPEGGQGSGIFSMHGSPKSLTDITPAAGWVILECDPHALKQEIRLVCRDDDHQGCEHLFAHGGAVNKVVRLPESCGSSPFARISRTDVADDQAIPDHLSHQIVRRDGSTPHVVSLAVDTDFEHLGTSGRVRGDVNWRFAATNGKLPIGYLNEPQLHARGETSGSWFDSALVVVAKAVKALSALAPPNDFFGAEGNGAQAKLPFNKTLSFFEKTLTCSGIKASTNAELIVKSMTTGYIGFVATGKAGEEPESDNMATLFRLKVDADAKFHIVASLTGHGKWPIPTPLRLPMGAIDIAGIISIGPMLVIQAYAEADLAISLDSTFNADFSMDLQYVIPTIYKDKVKSILSQDDGTAPKNSSLILGAAGEAVGELNIKGHFVPKISVGITAFKHNADVYVQTDIWSGLYVVGKAVASGSAKVRGKRDHFQPQISNVTERGLDAPKLPVTASATGSAGFTGSVVVSAGIDFTAGAEIKGSFVGFFKALAKSSGDALEKTFNHKKKWELYKKTYSAGKASAEAAKIEPKEVSSKGDPIACPSRSLGKPAIFEKGLSLLSSTFKKLTK